MKWVLFRTFESRREGEAKLACLRFVRFILFISAQVALAGCTGNGVARDQSGGPRGPDIDGEWVVPMASHLEVCRPPAAGAWAWSEHSLSASRLDANGQSIRSWTLPFAPRSMTLTSDCRYIWALDVSRSRVSVIDERVPGDAIGMRNGEKISIDIKDIIPCLNDSCAWAVGTQSDSVPVFLTRAQGGLTALSSRPFEGYELDDYARADHGRALWIVPTDPGIYLLDGTGFHSYQTFEKRCFAGVESSHDGSIGWLNPGACMLDNKWKEHSKGLYAVDVQLHALNNGQAILPDVEVNQIITRSWSDLVWLLSKEERLFVIRVEMEHGNIHIVPLNNGLPVMAVNGVEPLEIETISPASNGHAWAMASTSHDTPGVWSKIYQIEANGNEVKVKRQIEDQLPRSSIINTASDLTDPDRLWVRTLDRNWYELTPGVRSELRVKKLFVEGGPVLNVISGNKDERDHYWLGAQPTSYMMGPASELKSAVVELGPVMLTLEKTPLTIVPILPADLGSIKVHLDWPNRPEAAKVHGRVSVDIIKPAGSAGQEDDAVAGGTARIEAGTAEVHLLRSERFLSDHEYDVLVAYSDDNRSTIQARWHHVYFGLPWWKRFLYDPLTASFLWLFVPVVVVCAVLRGSATIRSWAPVAIPSLEIAGTVLLPEYVKPEYAKLSLPHLLVTAVVISLMAILVGVISPATLRAIAPSYPFKIGIPFALRFAFVRRRVFAEYAEEANEELQRERREANDERYVALPVAVQKLICNRGALPPISDATTVDEMVDALVASDPEARVHVVIEAPGGRGKSALLRAIFERTLARWRTDASAPLPVFGHGDATTLEDLAKYAFGRVAVSAEHFALQFATGDLILFVDGLSESRIDPGIIARYLRDAGRRTRLCLAMRPSPDYLRAIATNADRYLLVEPQRLTEHTLGDFLKAYVGTGSEDVGAGGDHPVDLKKWRRFGGFDGSYVPLLVRLALLAEDTAGSISDVYDACFTRLLRNQSITAASDQSELDRAAQDLSMATYVERKQRIFPTNREDLKEAQTIARLLKCGVLLSADPATRLGAEPRAVRFFHDSMQSYLAAKALGRKGRWDILLRVAGDDLFRQDRSDILGRAGSELFFMCVLSFGTAEDVAAHLRRQLDAWAVLHANAFAADQITDAIPDILRACDSYVSPEGRDVASYLKSAIALADQIQAPQYDDVMHQRRDYLATLYSTLAASVWAKMSASMSQT